jgi:hypothetical protein
MHLINKAALVRCLKKVFLKKFFPVKQMSLEKIFILSVFCQETVKFQQKFLLVLV